MEITASESKSRKVCLSGVHVWWLGLAVTVLTSALAWSNNVGPFSRENLLIRQIANHNSEIAKNPADDESRHLVQSANEIQDSVMMHYLVRDEESHTRVLAPKSTKSASKSSKSGSKSGKSSKSTSSPTLSPGPTESPSPNPTDNPTTSPAPTPLPTLFPTDGPTITAAPTSSKSSKSKSSKKSKRR